MEGLKKKFYFREGEMEKFFLKFMTGNILRGCKTCALEFYDYKSEKEKENELKLHQETPEYEESEESEESEENQQIEISRLVKEGLDVIDEIELVKKGLDIMEKIVDKKGLDAIKKIIKEKKRKRTKK